MDLLTLLLLMFWYVLPAYAANGLAVIFGRGNRLNAPLDFGKNFLDGKRIFGEGKTVRGFMGGVAAGTAVGVAQMLAGKTLGLPMLLFSPQTVTIILMSLFISPSFTSFIIFNIASLTSIYFTLLGYPPTIKEILFPSVAKGFLLSLGALTGDLAGSFIKRRLNISRGYPAPGLDQLDFITGAIILSSIIYIPPLEIVITTILVTPAIHLLANIAGYMLKLKREPW